MSEKRPGPTAVEYAVVLGLVAALAVVGAGAALGVAADDVFRWMNEALRWMGLG